MTAHYVQPTSPSSAVTVTINGGHLDVHIPKVVVCVGTLQEVHYVFKSRFSLGDQSLTFLCSTD